MNALIEKSYQKVRDVETHFIRSIMQKIDWDDRLVGIRGARGVGKTTLLFQRIKKTAYAFRSSLLSYNII